jgi:hypothetical protein
MLPPFMNAYGLLTKILEKVVQAQQPERFTQDFLKTKLGYDSGSSRPVIPLLKRIGFLASDGTPTKLYSRFRNPEERGAAMAEAIRSGYRELFERNEYAHDLPKDKLKNMIVEMSGLKPDDSAINAIAGTFLTLKSFANFDASEANEATLPKPVVREAQSVQTEESSRAGGTGLNLAYTINLNLPETTDVEVFNAIFKSLKEHLLRS